MPHLGSELSDEERMERARHMRHWALLLIGFIVALFVEMFDSFHQASIHHEVGADIAQITDAPVLRWLKRDGSREDIARRAVTVLLIDRQTQSDAKDGGSLSFDTPFMPYSVQAIYLKRIIASRPAAIFIDLSYQRKSDDQGYQKLLDALRKAKAQNIPVFSGAISNDGYFNDLRALVRPVSTQWLKGRHALDYPFIGYGGLDTGAARIADRPTAAASIYDYLCAHQPPKATFKCDLHVEAASDFKADEEDKGAMAPIMVQWPQYRYRPNELYSSEAKCRNAPKTPLGGYLQDLTNGLLYNLTDPERRGASKCLFISSFSLDELYSFYSGSGSGGDPVFAKPNGALLDNYVTGKVVMIGDGMGSDNFDTPEHGLIAGVFHHAFALENLLANGRDYIRWPREITLGKASVQINFILEWFLTLLEVYILTHLAKVSKILPDVVRRNALLAAGLSVSLIFLLAYLLDFSMYAFLHWVPINPLYVLALVSIFNIISDQERIFEAYLRLPLWKRLAIVGVPLAIGVLTVFLLWLFFLPHGSGN